MEARQGEVVTAFELALVVPKRDAPPAGDGDTRDCVEFLVQQLRNAGLVVERVQGLSEEFLKLAAPLDTLGKAATEVEMRKPTHIGMDLLFEWDQVDAFIRQPDGSLFSWYERFICFNHLVYGIVNKSCSNIYLEYDNKSFWWKTGESLLRKMDAEGIVKQVFPLHDESKRKLLLRKWGLRLLDVTWQPIDEIYGYFGMKIATYFSFLGMYTNWLLFPAAFGLMLDFIDFGSWQLLALPIFFVLIVTWAALFFQFWKRKNAALLTRWQVSYSIGWEPGHKVAEFDWGPLLQPYVELKSKIASETPKRGEKTFLREDLVRRLMRVRNDVIVVSGIICLQVPFELAYAYLYEVAVSDAVKFILTTLYLLVIQYYTRLCGKISVKLIKYEHNKSKESSADSLVYKVFGLYFIQSYIGLFYHTILYRNILTLRQVLIQRLIVSQVVENLLENTIPFLKYSIKKYKAVKKKNKSLTPTRKALQLASRVEKEYLKPSYCASIGEELEDGLFDDFLELALQFGMIMMFACAFPLAFVFAAVNNITEIRTDAVKLLVILRRPIPRAAATIGAWMNIFQFLIVMAICTNCVLLVCFYDTEGKWTLEPGLAAILVVEHVLLLMKFVFSRIVPEEPAWVRASRAKNAAQVRDVYSKQLLRSLYSVDRKRE